MISANTLSAVSLGERAIAAFIAALLGGFILFGVGFTTISPIHNSGHDTRHSFAFPCH